MAEDRWEIWRETNWCDLIDTLDRVLAREYPGLEQSDPVKFKGCVPEAIRLTIQLCHDREKHGSPPEIFIFVTAVELQNVRPTPGGLEDLLKTKITEHSFEEAGHPGTVIHTSVRKDEQSAWHALCVDGSKWTFHEQQALWVKDKPEVAAA